MIHIGIVIDGIVITIDPVEAIPILAHKWHLHYPLQCPNQNPHHLQVAGFLEAAAVAAVAVAGSLCA